MNLNEIRLQPIVLAELYKKSLIAVQVNTNTSSIVLPDEALTDPFQFMGNNLKQILIIVYYPDTIFIPDEQLIFLTAVLKACNLTLEDTAIVNFATFKPGYNVLRQRMLPRIALFFGGRAEYTMILGNPTEFEHENIGGIPTLLVPELERLNQNNDEGKILKKKLWAALKRLFDSTAG